MARAEPDTDQLVADASRGDAGARRRAGSIDRDGANDARNSGITGFRPGSLLTKTRTATAHMPSMACGLGQFFRSDRRRRGGWRPCRWWFRIGVKTVCTVIREEANPPQVAATRLVSGVPNGWWSSAVTAPTACVLASLLRPGSVREGREAFLRRLLFQQSRLGRNYQVNLLAA
jgi:hypothetical protein